MRLSDHKRRIAVRGTLTLWIALTATLAATTFFTDAGPYGSWWFAAMWGVQAAVLVTVMTATRMWSRIGSMILHSALLLILAGERSPPFSVSAEVW